ncbi:MAG: DUF2851 family protein [bacterium]|nr:DUF2851 family protein [bacterium]
MAIKKCKVAAKQNYLKETFFSWIWQTQSIKTNPLTEDSQSINVVFPGELNVDDGPDFKNAIIEFNGLSVSGDVEIHTFSSDWNLHKHYTDPKYNNVILHVVGQRLERSVRQNNTHDCFTKTGNKIPALDLSKWSIKPLNKLFKEYTKTTIKTKSFICCHKKDIPNEELKILLEQQGLKRFELRKQKFQNAIKSYSVEQAVYSGIMEALGYAKNKNAFAKLAEYIDAEKLKQITHNVPVSTRIKLIKTALLGTAGLLPEKLNPVWKKIKPEIPNIMNPYEWQFFKVRPHNFPINRINAISCFLARTIQTGMYNSLVKYELNLEEIEKHLQPYCKNSKSKIGKPCAGIIILNVWLPILSATREDLQDEIVEKYKTYKPLPDNYITNYMKQILPAYSAGRFKDKKGLCCEIYNQGMIHIYNNFCRTKQCKDCPIKKEMFDN